MNNDINIAVAYFSKIGKGKDNALQRPRNARVDRKLRRLIEEAQGAGDIIINVGEGYYRPDMHNPAERGEYLHYIAQLKSRIRAHVRNIAALEKAARAKMLDGEHTQT